MHVYALAFSASFVFVGLKAAQQLNVVHDRYLLILPTSFLMAMCEVYVVSQAAMSGWGWIVIPIGLGSGLGCLLAMYLHKKLRRS